MVTYLQKIVKTFYKDHQEKSTALSLPLDFVLPIANLIVKLFTKQKQRCSIKDAMKRTKK